MRTKFNGHSPLDFKVVHQNGSFVRERYWFRGWITDLARFGCVKFIENGYTGKETVLTIERISAAQTFLASEAQTTIAA